MKSRDHVRDALVILVAGMIGGVCTGLGIGILVRDPLMGIAIGISLGAGSGGVLASVIHDDER
jgi:uncharacterized membrane protein